MDDSCRSALLNMISKNRSIRKLEVRFPWPQDVTVRTLADFECHLLGAIQSIKPRVLEYVRLYNDGLFENRKSKEDPDFRWAIIWDQPTPASSFDDQDGSFECKEDSSEKKKV